MNQMNPFLIEGYLSAEYFCDRVEETALLTRHLTNGCNVALIAPRRLGKSGLVFHCFQQDVIVNQYYTFYIDIYETKNLDEFVNVMGKAILNGLKTRGRKAWEFFLSFLHSIESKITFDRNGNPEWSISVGQINVPEITLDEIFDYLSHADRPCLVAIDEFQTIVDYPEKTVEAVLRKRIQNCHNAHFVFSGSKRHMMSMMFASPSKPFYNSSSIMGLEPIERSTYLDFANRHLAKNMAGISEEAFNYLYDLYDGTTWYIQYVLNILYTTPCNGIAFEKEDVKHAINTILSQHQYAFNALLYQLSSKQKIVIQAIAKEGKATELTSQAFLQSCFLGASTMQGILKSLLQHDFITCDEGVYQVYDKFFAQWLCR